MQGTLLPTVNPFHSIMLLPTPLFSLSYFCPTALQWGCFEYLLMLYLCLILYTPVLTKYLFRMYNSNAHLYLTPCSLQSLSLDLLRKMTSSLAQNNTLLDLVLDCKDLTQKEDVKLFTHHFLLGLSTNTTSTDLSLSLPKQCWDWLQEGEVCGRFEGYHCSIVSKSK